MQTPTKVYEVKNVVLSILMAKSEFNFFKYQQG